jgi:transposase
MYKALVARSDRHDLPSTISMRKTYLALLSANRATCPRTGTVLLARPEVYLDESYVDPRMHPKFGWTLDNAPIAAPAAAGRVCMIGAGVARTVDGALQCHWVPGAFEAWKAADGATTRSGTPRDYHGNMTAALFEAWFTKLCRNVLEQYGPSVFIMDGAAYHRRRIDPPPATTAKKAVLAAFLDRINREAMARKEHPFFDASARHTKAELQDLVRRHQPVKQLAAVLIGRRYGHNILFTPPYHPELQPIEVVWGALKNSLRMRQIPWTSTSSLVTVVKEAQQRQAHSVWMGARAKVAAFEQNYTN